MKKKSSPQSAFFNLRVLIGLCVFMGGVFLALVSFGPATSGFAQGTTRGQMAVALAQALNVQPPACVPGSEMFNDVPASNPFCPFIEELARRGITGGCAPGLYCPGASITRAQMAAFIVKATDEAAFGRNTVISVQIPSDSTSVQLTEVTVTPKTTGSILARARGYCNFLGATAGFYYNVVTAIGVDAGDAFNTSNGNIGVTGHVNNGPGSIAQSQFSAERVFAGTAGVPITLRAFGRQEEGLADSNIDCSASLTLEELPYVPFEVAAPRRAPGGTTVSPTISR